MKARIAPQALLLAASVVAMWGFSFVPIKLGWRDRPLLEHELNPAHPHT